MKFTIATGPDATLTLTEAQYNALVAVLACRGLAAAVPAYIRSTRLSHGTSMAHPWRIVAAATAAGNLERLGLVSVAFRLYHMRAVPTTLADAALEHTPSLRERVLERVRQLVAHHETDGA